MRLIKPSGGSDAVVHVSAQGEWSIFDGGMKAVVARRPLEDLVELASLRDFFDIDEQGRVWVGPEVWDGVRWTAFGRSAVDAGGGVRFEERTLLDPGQRGWVPFSTELDCVPPNYCAATGLRVFAPDGSTVEDVALRRPGVGAAGAADTNLVTLRSGVPGGAVASSGDAARAASRRPSKSAGGGGSSKAHDTAALPQRLDQGGASDWIVSPNEYFELPGSEPQYYPYLDPREFLSTGLRNSGYASAAAVSPSGRLQVVTWLERDLGSQVAYQILLNTLAEDGWLVEDLTNTPFLGGDVEFESVVAMDYCSDGALWLATQAGKIGVRQDGERPDGAWTVYPEGSGVLKDGAVVSDIGCGPDGAVWIGTQSGLLGYGFAMPPVLLYVPSASQHR